MDGEEQSMIHTALAFAFGGVLVLAAVGAAEVARWWREGTLNGAR